MDCLVDVVNFNADASCLAANDWHKALEGGCDSLLYCWLELYVTYHKKVALGFTGATAADIAVRNPEAITFINNHPNIFEIIIRPFSHDISFLRTPQGFDLNLSFGLKTILHLFHNISNFYLPPEFMCTAMQIRQLAHTGITGIFINPERFDDQIAPRIPKQPYFLQGAFDTRLGCISFAMQWTSAYLNSIHNFTANKWNRLITESSGIVYAWRDGESSFLLPDTLKREEAWLRTAKDGNHRAFLSETLTSSVSWLCISEQDRTQNYLKTYPVHPFTAWIKEMKMFWYINQILKLEAGLERFDFEQKIIWLHAINSDILSAVEKRSPVIHIKTEEFSNAAHQKFTIHRQEKNLEGEEYLYLLENFQLPNLREYYQNCSSSHIVKLRDRTDFLTTLGLPNATL